MSESRVLAAILLAVAVSASGACGGASGGDTTREARSSTTMEGRSSTAVAESAAAPAAPSAPTTTTHVRPSTPTTGALAASPAKGREADPTTVARPAPAGSYAYKTTGSSQTNGGPPKTYPALTFLGVEPPRGTSQEATRDLRDTRGDGQLTQTVLQYRESGVLLESVVIRASQSGYSEVVDLAPVQPALIATGAPKPGDHYEFDLRSRSGGQVDAHAIVDVLRAERVVVGGSEYDTVVTRLDLRLSGHVVGRTVADAWISPENQLALKEHVSGEARSGLNTLSSTYDAVLRDPPTMSP